MRKIYLLIVLVFCSTYSFGQVSGSINVGGDFDKYYPVTFFDGGWNNNVPTEVILGRSNTHIDSFWRGSLIASFRYHVTAYGHGSNFIEADIKSTNNFIASWCDGSNSNATQGIVIWLRGGGTTYYYQSNYAVNPTVYDGVQNPLPYNEVNGPAHSFKTAIEEYATSSGTYQNRNAYFMANVGIGITNPTNKLDVNGTIHSKEVKVDMNGWSDFVFKKEYDLPTLEEVEKQINEKGHLANIPSEAEVLKDGINLGEMNAKLLQKIEELTLYMIEMKKENEAIKNENKVMRNNQTELEKRMSKIENK